MRWYKKLIVISFLVVIILVMIWFFFLRVASPEPIFSAYVSEAIQYNNVIAVVKVKSREIKYRGTKSETAFYILDAQEFLLNETEEPIRVCAYTIGSKHYLSYFKKYLVLLEPAEDNLRRGFSLYRFEPYSIKREEEILECIKTIEKTN